MLVRYTLFFKTLFFKYHLFLYPDLLQTLNALSMKYPLPYRILYFRELFSTIVYFIFSRIIFNNYLFFIFEKLFSTIVYFILSRIIKCIIYSTYQLPYLLPYQLRTVSYHLRTVPYTVYSYCISRDRPGPIFTYHLRLPTYTS